MTASKEGRAARVIDVRAAEKEDRLKPQSSYGVVLNYSLFASSNTLFEGTNDLFQGISEGFDARVFGPYGTLSQSFIAGYAPNSDLDGFTRLNTTWSYSDPERLVTYRAGDLISGGLSWTRPVYLGGMQVARNFHLRSDLMTMPLPSFEGTAAVPRHLRSIPERAHLYRQSRSRPVSNRQPADLFRRGEAQVVLRDALGRETATTLPFYSSDMPLAEGPARFLGRGRLSPAQFRASNGSGSSTDVP